MTTSKPPLQKCIHGSPGNRSSISWDPWNTLWESVVYKIQAFIHWNGSRLGFDTHKTIVWRTGAIRIGHFCAAGNAHKVNRFRLQKKFNQDMTSHSCCMPTLPCDRRQQKEQWHWSELLIARVISRNKIISPHKQAGRMEVRVHAFSTSVLGGGEWTGGQCC